MSLIRFEVPATHFLKTPSRARGSWNRRRDRDAFARMFCRFQWCHVWSAAQAAARWLFSDIPQNRGGSLENAPCGRVYGTASFAESWGCQTRRLQRELLCLSLSR